MLLLAPLGIRALAAIAGRAPVAARLALRDLARYQARSGAALAAASLAIGIAATIAVTAAAQQAQDHALTGGKPAAGPAHRLARRPESPGSGGPGLSAAPADGATATPTSPNPAAVANARWTADAIAQALGSKDVVELDVAVDLTTRVPSGAPPDAIPGEPGPHDHRAEGGQGWRQVATPYVATPAVLSLYRITAADITAAATSSARAAT